MYSCTPKISLITSTVGSDLPPWGAARYAGMLPPETGICTSPACRPSAEVRMAVDAAAGPVAAVKPVARAVTTKARRSSRRGGSRLSNCESRDIGNLLGWAARHGTQAIMHLQAGGVSH